MRKASIWQCRCAKCPEAMILRAITALDKALKDEVGLPLHFLTHDTSWIAAASVLAAVEAGCDAVDGAFEALSGRTSQPNLGSIAAALKGSGN